MSSEHELSSSLEDYLEAIFHIVNEKQAARAKDISERMRVTSSSVTGALHALSNRELVNYVPYDIVTLTPKGKRAAEEIVRRHEAMHGFFREVLGVGSAEAEDAACKLEHMLPPALFERFLLFLEFVNVYPEPKAEWVREFRQFCETMDQEEERGLTSEEHDG